MLYVYFHIMTLCRSYSQYYLMESRSDGVAVAANGWYNKRYINSIIDSLIGIHEMMIK